jgi:hypothetical protein
MSGQKYRSVINQLVGSISDARYLEIGSWAGLTAATALYGNTVKCCVLITGQSLVVPENFFRKHKKSINA